MPSSPRYRAAYHKTAQGGPGGSPRQRRPGRGGAGQRDASDCSARNDQAGGPARSSQRRQWSAGGSLRGVCFASAIQAWLRHEVGFVSLTVGRVMSDVVFKRHYPSAIAAFWWGGIRRFMRFLQCPRVPTQIGHGRVDNEDCQWSHLHSRIEVWCRK
jgi:hypothetical protein